MKTNGFLQPCSQVSIFLLHFIAKDRSNALFLFSDPIGNKPTLTNISYTKKAFPAERDENNATMKRKNPQAFRATTKKKSVFPFHSR